MFSIKKLSVALIAAVSTVVFASPVMGQKKVLFDASHRENAANADWVIDADSISSYQEKYPCGVYQNESTAQRFPTPDQSGITASTPETYWRGGISAFGVDLVKAGYYVETLPEGADITYGDGTNAQDLTNYDVFILPEPNKAYSTSEKAAIINFIENGGGLFLITDHQTSDRDCDGWDSPHIGNDLMGVEISGGAIVNYGLFGIVNNVQEISGMTNADYWFDDGVDNNVTTDPSDPIIYGPHGDGTGGLGFFGATALTIDPTTNSTVKGHVWKTTASSQGNELVTFATAIYGSGRIAVIGDSSPADDGTGDPGDTLWDGWDKAAGGVSNKEIHLNAVEWLANAVPDTTPPTITSGPTAIVGDTSVTITWTTNESANSVVEYGLTQSYGSTEQSAVFVSNHSITITGLNSSTTYYYRVGSTDRQGNGPTYSGNFTVTTSAPQPPVITSGPTVESLTTTSATIVWQTNEPADSRVDYGLTSSYGDYTSNAALVTSHSLVISNLTADTLYHFSVSSTDADQNGPTTSSDQTFTTTSGENIDISGWTIYQYDSSQSYTFPANTTIPAGGYLVLARNASQSSFEAEWGTLPAGTVYVNSGEKLPMINGSESFKLSDDTGTTIDGTTISMSKYTSIQRNNPGDPAGSTSSWTSVNQSSGTPGSGAGTPSSAGVVINEASDASAYNNEFVELFFDEVAADTVAPATVNDLTVSTVDTTTLQVQWTAVGDDDTSGTATTYDIRYSTSVIASDTDFDNATQVLDEPIPALAGTSEQLTIDGLDPATTYWVAIKVSDEVPNWSGLTVDSGTTQSDNPQADYLVISEVQVKGTSDHNDEFIELYNPTGSSVSLSGLSIQYKSATGTTFIRYNLPTDVMQPYGFYLIARSEYTGSATPDTTIGSFLMGASGGHVFLVNGVANLTDCNGSDIIDKVGWGTADCSETSSATAHDFGQSIERLPGENDPDGGNGTDTNNNSNDFAVRSSSGPQNSSSVEYPSNLADHMLISEIQVLGSSNHSDEFIELYNPTGSGISLAGWSVQYKSATGTTYLRFSLPSVTVASNHFFLIARSEYIGSTTPDLTNGTFLMSSSGGNLYLVNSTATLTSCTDSSIVDRVGYGTGNCPEGTAATVHDWSESMARSPLGADTDDNSADFTVTGSTTPQNSTMSQNP